MVLEIIRVRKQDLDLTIDIKNCPVYLENEGKNPDESLWLERINKLYKLAPHDTETHLGQEASCVANHPTFNRIHVWGFYYRKVYFYLCVSRNGSFICCDEPHSSDKIVEFINTLYSEIFNHE